MARLGWGMVGGGEGSQIGPTHRMAAAVDGLFDFAAGALDHRPEEGRAYGRSLGLDDGRSYGDWREMLEGESARDDRVDLVTVATPNATHHEIARAFLEHGFHVLCEKPMTMTVAEAEDLVGLSRDSGLICAVNYGYTGYPLVRQMRAMVAAGELGRIRLVKAEFSHGHHADAADADNPRIRWRYDPAQIGPSAQFADCGIHALHMASFVIGQEAETLSADLASCVAGRELEDDAMVNIRFDAGAVGRLWTSAIALGRQHGLALQVFGESGGLAWEQERPDQLRWTPLGGRQEVIERGGPDLSPEAQDATRVAVGHAEGFPLAVANIYGDLAKAIRAARNGSDPRAAAGFLPMAEDGLRSVAAVHAVVRSGGSEGAWVDARPASLR